MNEYQSSTDVHFSCFLFFLPINNAALYIHVEVSLGMCLFNFSCFKSLVLKSSSLSKQECEMQAS